jgi:hypothetical protein
MVFTKNFTKDIQIIKNAILKKEKFSFSKYADGERYILNSLPITNIDNWKFDPNSDNVFQQMLMESFKYNDLGYYIGISCPCCDLHSYNWFKKNKGSNDNNTTFANIFVNGNYNSFKNELLPLFNNYERIFLVANENSNLLELKKILKITDFFGIGPEAFKTNLDLPNKLIEKINSEKINNSLFLFCAGPMGNVLSHRLWNNNKENTYIDIGSTLNPWFGRNLRDYQTNGECSNKNCHF